ncbi:MAG: class I SAM-dependent methyltransferase [Legionella sp.]|nr:class I SAM-dependent methyltransferase [Legionella sp.]
MKNLTLSPALYDYLLDVSLREDPTLQALRKETAALPAAQMQIAPDQGQFMQFLIRLIGAKTVLELGTFTGYSALAMALALPEDGRVVTCDISEDSTAMATAFWQRAKQDKKIQLRLGPALTTLKNLLHEGYASSFDFIFIDADKANYCQYYELALTLLSTNGMIAIDNVLWEGQVIDPTDTNQKTLEIRRLNEYIKQDKRVDVSLVSIADGLFLIQKKRMFNER